MDAPIIARIAHEADRSFMAACGDTLSRTWLALDQSERQRAVKSVFVVLRNPGLDARQLHDLWQVDRRSHGWSYGPVFDPEAKHDPRLVDFADLPAPERRRDQLFVGIVNSLTASTPTPQGSLT